MKPKILKEQLLTTAVENRKKKSKIHEADLLVLH